MWTIKIQCFVLDQTLVYIKNGVQMPYNLCHTSHAMGSMYKSVVCPGGFWDLPGDSSNRLIACSHSHGWDGTKLISPLSMYGCCNSQKLWTNSVQIMVIQVLKMQCLKKQLLILQPAPSWSPKKVGLEETSDMVTIITISLWLTTHYRQTEYCKL